MRGPQTETKNIILYPGHYFGIRFMPGEIPQISKELITGKTLLNSMVNTKAVIKNSHFNELEKLILNTDYFELQIALFMAYYNEYYSIDRSPKMELIYHLLYLVNENKETIKVAEISKEVIYSEQYINRVFRQYTGMPLKTYFRILRRHHLLNILINHIDKHLDLLNISSQAGYYDQSHMIKDFRNFT